VRRTHLPDAKGNATVVDGTVIETASTAVVVEKIGETTATIVTADVKLIQTVNSDDEVETTTTTGEHEIETGTETDIENENKSAVEIVPTTKIVIETRIVNATGTVPHATTASGAKEITIAEVIEIEIERTVTDTEAVID